MAKTETATVDLSELARELYLVPAGDFVATRDEVARHASRAGQPGLALGLRRLRRPSQSAWLVNLLAHHEPADMRGLSELGRDLRDAQTRPDAARLRQLCEDRRNLIAALLARGRQHAAEAGVQPTGKALADAEATLRAAVVDVGAAAAAQSGRLVRPMVHQGFGPLPSPQEQPASPMEPERENWAFWPVDAPPAPAPESSRPAVAPPPRTPPLLSLAPPHPAPPAAEDVPDPTADALAAAETQHWRCEQELHAAETAAAAALDEVAWFDRQRVVARQERKAAQRRLADARSAQRSSARALARARRAFDEAGH